MIFKVIGDVHPDGHYLGYIIYSPVLGCVITGLPRHDVAAHYSCRHALAAIHDDPVRVDGARAGGDLLAIVARIIDSGVAEKFGVTGSFLAGCFNARSDIDTHVHPGADAVWVVGDTGRLTLGSGSADGAELVLQGPDS